MSKKISAFLICTMCCFLFTGCNDVIDLTEEQSTLIAEYAAGLLLKYDRNYEDRLYEGKKEEEELAESEQNDWSASEQAETQVSTEEEMIFEKGEDGISSPETENAGFADSEKDIAKIADVAGMSITYKDYLVTSQYPVTDGEGETVHLEASDGYQLFVLQFKVANITEDTAEISMLNRDVDYRIICNGSKAAKPMLTILMNDLGTLETTVKPGEEQEAVLVFEISENLKDSLDSIDLKVNYNDMEHVIKIK